MGVACVLINNFPFRQEVNKDPKLQNEPTIIYQSSGSKRYVLDYSPRLGGIHQNMPLPEALSMVREVNLLQPDIPLYNKAFDKVVNSLLDKSPIVEPAELGCAYVGLDGLEDMYGGEATMISNLLKLPPEGRGVCIGVSKGKFLAKLAAKFACPGKVFKTPPDIQAFLKELPVEVLPIYWGLKKRLHALGLHTLGQIAAHKAEPFKSQFGPQGTRIWNLANGIDATPLIPHQKQESIRASISFSGFIYSLEPMLIGVESLLGQIFSSSHLRCRSIRIFVLEGQTMQGFHWSHRMVFREPVGDAFSSFSLIRDVLTSQTLPGPLGDMSLTVSGFANDTGRQLAILPKVRGKEALRSTVKQLEARLGKTVPIFQIRSIEPWSRIPERRQGLVQFAP